MLSNRFGRKPFLLLIAIVSIGFSRIAFAEAVAAVHVAKLDKQREPECVTLVAGARCSVSTIQSALSLVRAFRVNEPSYSFPVSILISDPIYRLTEEIKLEEKDSGTLQSPTVLSSSSKEPAVLSGAVLLPDDGWSRVEKCKGCLPGTSLFKFNLGRINYKFHRDNGRYGYGVQPPQGLVNLYVDGRSVQPARWPNSGYAAIARVDGLDILFDESAGAVPSPMAASVRASGYFFHSWADFTRVVKDVLPNGKGVRMTRPVTPYSVRKGGMLYLSNDLAFIDVPNEWYVDEDDNLWLSLKDGVTPLHVEIAASKNIFVMKGLKFFHIKNLSIFGARSDGVVADDVSQIRFDDVKFSGHGGWAAKIKGRNSSFKKVLVEDVSAGGLYLKGGDRAALMASGLTVEDSFFTDFSKRIKTRAPALWLAGVGNSVRNSIFKNGPHTAIFIEGNENVVRGCTLNNVVLETSDAGAIYIGRDWTARGNKIERNYFYSITATNRAVRGIYLDDQTSGTVVANNVFWAVSDPVYVGGGSDNVISRNFFINSGAVVMDQRGVSWQKARSFDPAWDLQTRLKVVPFDTSPVWKRKYPELVNILTDGFGIPRRNAFLKNVFSGPYFYNFKLDSTVYNLQKIDPPIRAVNDFSGNLPPDSLGAVCSALKEDRRLAGVCSILD